MSKHSTSTNIMAFTEKDQFSYNKFNFPALFTVFGTPKSGKSYFVFHLLKEIKDNFDRIIIYLGTKDAAAGFLGLAEGRKKIAENREKKKLQFEEKGEEEEQDAIVVKYEMNDSITEIKTRCAQLTKANETYENLVKEKKN